MQSLPFADVSEFVIAAAGENCLQTGERFLLLDGARFEKVESWLTRHVPTECWSSLLGATLGSPLMSASPVLIRLDAQVANEPLRRILKQKEYRRAVSVLVSDLSLAELAAHLNDYITVLDPDQSRWFLAFWDPYILASLVGLSPAISAIVPGPVFTPKQISGLLHPITCWCFHDRNGEARAVTQQTHQEGSKPPFDLTQDQMDQLMDISLPEAIINTLVEVAPQLVPDRDSTELHTLCCEAIRTARDEGRNSLADYAEHALKAMSAIRAGQGKNCTMPKESDPG